MHKAKNLILVLELQQDPPNTGAKNVVCRLVTFMYRKDSVKFTNGFITPFPPTFSTTGNAVGGKRLELGPGSPIKVL